MYKPLFNHHQCHYCNFIQYCVAHTVHCLCFVHSVSPVCFLLSLLETDMVSLFLFINSFMRKLIFLLICYISLLYLFQLLLILLPLQFLFCANSRLHGMFLPIFLHFVLVSCPLPSLYHYYFQYVWVLHLACWVPSPY